MMYRSAFQKICLTISAVLLLITACNTHSAGKADILNAEEYQWLQEHKEQLYFAPDPFYAPFEFYDAQDKTTKGLAHDYIRLIEKKIGISFIEIKSGSFNEILSLAKEKKVSIVNAATVTAERSKYLNFTDPYIEVKNIILMKKSSIGNITPEGLAGKKISVVRGYAVTEYLVGLYPDYTYDVVSSDLTALLNVAYGVSDAAVIDIATSSYLTDREGITDLRVAGDVGYPIKLAVGSRKDWPELTVIMNKALKSITEEERKEIARTWIHIDNNSFLENRYFRITVISVFLAFFLIIGSVIIWNRMLTGQVHEKTADLRQELKKRTDAEESLRDALKEKDILIKELFHRTRNNMQVISSMLSLQTAVSADENVKKALEAARSRVLSMSLVHQQLYQAQNLSIIYMDAYLKDLLNMLRAQFPEMKSRIEIQEDIEPVQLLIDTAIPCGMVFYELVSNAFIHAFPNGRSGLIRIHFARGADGTIEFDIMDNGIGVSQGYNFNSITSLGLQIINNTVEHQLDGNVAFGSSPGLTCLIRFKEKDKAARV